MDAVAARSNSNESGTKNKTDAIRGRQRGLKRTCHFLRCTDSLRPAALGAAARVHSSCLWAHQYTHPVNPAFLIKPNVVPRFSLSHASLTAFISLLLPSSSSKASPPLWSFYFSPKCLPSLSSLLRLTFSSCSERFTYVQWDNIQLSIPTSTAVAAGAQRWTVGLLWGH